jgi:opacity protein-like surface antigen
MLLCLNSQWSRAEDTNVANTLPQSFAVGDLFASGRYEAAFSSGVLFSPVGTPRNRPVINYTMTGVQLGWMPGGVHGSGLLRGSFEVAGEGFGSAIFEGPGSYVAGVTTWVRYNFVPPRWRFVPYVQGGAGVVSTDIDRGIVGQPFNFNLDLGVGVRYFIAPRWSVNLEYRYQHISNANLGKSNIGINSQGPILGMSYFF